MSVAGRIQKPSRRTVLAALAASAGGAEALAAPQARTTVWTFDNLQRIAGLPPEVEGAPKVIRTPVGGAIQFDGERDAIFLDRHPLAGASQFTIEALFRPDGGAFEQRWLHLESNEGPGWEPGRGKTRTLFEIRVVEQSWYLDAFLSGPKGSRVLITPEKRFPVGRWSHVAQTWRDGVYRAYVDGELQAEGPVPFDPPGPGRASVGVRMNRVSYFRGAVRQAAFTDAALDPSQFRLRQDGRRLQQSGG